MIKYGIAQEVTVETAWGEDITTLQQQFEITAADVGKPLMDYTFTQHDIGAMICVITARWNYLSWYFLRYDDDVLH